METDVLGNGLLWGVIDDGPGPGFDERVQERMFCCSRRSIRVPSPVAGGCGVYFGFGWDWPGEPD